MSKAIARFMFESSPFDPFWSAFLVGFCIIGPDGKVYLTEAGAEYLNCCADQFASEVLA